VVAKTSGTAGGLGWSPSVRGEVRDGCCSTVTGFRDAERIGDVIQPDEHLDDGTVCADTPSHSSWL